MIQYTFDAMFRTTNKGLPDTQNLSPYTYLTMNHFVYSLIVQIVIGLVVTGFAGMSVYRAFYKINNQKLFPAGQGQENADLEQETKSKSEAEDIKSKSEGQGDENTNDNLIYRFDEDEEKDENKNKDKEDQEEDQEENQDQEETVSHETNKQFLQLDHKMLYLQSFLIPFAVAVNVFASNIMVVISLVVALVLFYLFNIKQICRNTTVLQLLFTIPCILVFLVVFFEDRDMST